MSRRFLLALQSVLRAALAPIRLVVWRPLRGLLRWLLALLILFEEWGWDALSHALGQLARLLPRALLQRLEAAIRALPPPAALAVLLLPSLLLVPIKLTALWLIAHGRGWLGLAVIVLAKLAGTALLARLYLLTQAQLMRMAWFARLHGRWIDFKQRLLAQVRASAAYRSLQALRQAARDGARRARVWLRSFF